MTAPPNQPRIYHITRVENLPSILAASGLLSDATMIRRGGPTVSIGIRNIKARRLERPVACYPTDKVGEYVPFYFCARSVMLYLLHKGNHPDLDYRGGQESIVHLEADLDETISWAASENRRWAFTLSNAAAAYTEFRNTRSDLSQINWPAVRESNWSNPEIKEGKQAEFLVRESFPWTLVRRVGVQTPAVHSQVIRAIASEAHRPPVEVLPSWYY